MLKFYIEDESRRSRFVTNGALRETPLDIVDISEIYEYRTVKSQFRCPATIMTNLFDPWNASDCRVSGNLVICFR
jgi:hypothetical protein